VAGINDENAAGVLCVFPASNNDGPTLSLMYPSLVQSDNAMKWSNYSLSSGTWSPPALTNPGGASLTQLSCATSGNLLMLINSGVDAYHHTCPNPSIYCQTGWGSPQIPLSPILDSNRNYMQSSTCTRPALVFFPQQQDPDGTFIFFVSPKNTLNYIYGSTPGIWKSKAMWCGEEALYQSPIMAFLLSIFSLVGWLYSSYNPHRAAVLTGLCICSLNRPRRIQRLSHRHIVRVTFFHFTSGLGFSRAGFVLTDNQVFTSMNQLTCLFQCFVVRYLYLFCLSIGFTGCLPWDSVSNLASDIPCWISCLYLEWFAYPQRQQSDSGHLA